MSYLRLRRRVAPPAVVAGKAHHFIERVAPAPLDAADRIGRLISKPTDVPTVINDDSVKFGLTPVGYNWLRNSGFWFAQRGVTVTAAPTTRTIGPDGWGLSCGVSSTVNITPSSLAFSASYAPGIVNLNLGTRGNRVLITQVLEHVDTCALRGATVRLQAFYEAVPAGGGGEQVLAKSPGMRMAIAMLSGGVADALPATFSSGLASEGAPLQLGTNLSYLTPRRNGVDNGIVDGSTILCNQTRASIRHQPFVTGELQRTGGLWDIPTTAQNLIVMFWSDAFDNDATLNHVYLGRASLTVGQAIQPWAPMSIEDELRRVQRYYCKSLPLINNNNIGNGAVRGMVSVAGAAAGQVLPVAFPVEMRSAPTVVTQNIALSSNSFVRNTTNSTEATATAAANVSTRGCDITFTGLGGGTAWTVGQSVAVQYLADAEL